MFRFSARLLTADAWSGVDTKIHTQDNHYWAKKVWNGLRGQFNQLSQQYKIKGVALQEWIKEYGIQGLFAAQERDPAIRKALNDVRSILKETVTSTDEGGQFRNNEIQAFRAEYGNNVADWLYALTGQKRAARRKRKEKAGAVAKEPCHWCEAASTTTKDDKPICKQCLDEDDAVAKKTKPRQKGVISSLLER